jgi:hypothetical protein
MSAMEQAKAQFEAAWADMFRVYRPLINATDGEGIVHRVSAVKGLAWNLYLQGRTDEMARQLTLEKRLVSSAVTRLVRSRRTSP